VASANASLLCTPDAFGRRRKKCLQQLTDCIGAILAQPKLPIFEIGWMAQGLALDAILINPNEVQSP